MAAIMAMKNNNNGSNNNVFIMVISINTICQRLRGSDIMAWHVYETWRGGMERHVVRDGGNSMSS